MSLPALDLVRAVLEDSRTLGFLGPGPIEDHVEHALGFAAILGREPVTVVVDLGSGGGVPALVLAARSDASFALVDRSTQRCAFLVEAVEELGLDDRVVVVEDDAETLVRESDLAEQVDVVTARSFGPPAVTAEAACRYLRSDGRLIVSEPPGAEAGRRWEHEELETLGLAFESLEVVGDASFAVIRRTDTTIDDRYPRRPATTRKRPLF